MNWMTVAWPMMTATCLTLALINLRIAMGDGRRAPHVFFSLGALAVAAVSVFELTLLRTDDLARYDEILRWAAVPISIMVACVTGFIYSFFGTGRRWLAITAVGLNALANLANLISDGPAIRKAVALHHGETFGGVKFTVSSVVNGPWNIVEIISVILVDAFILDASIKLWRQGERRRAFLVGGSVIFFLMIGRGHATLVEKGLVDTPYFVSFGFIGVIIAMGMELGNDVLRATSLARELSDSQRRMDMAGRAAVLGFWEWDIASGMIWANETARKLFGIPASEPVSLTSFLGTLHPDDREGVVKAIDESMAGGFDYEKEYRVMIEHGEVRWISAKGRIEANGGQPVRMRGVLLDITERRISESELHLVRGQLAHAGRVSMMGQLAAALAHELNQPLGAILRNAEAAELFLQAPTPDLEELRAIIRDILRDDKRAGGVIDRLKALLKRKDIEPRALSVKDLLEEVLALIRADASARGVRLEVSTPSDLPDVSGDRVHLQQVLINLIINGMDALSEIKRSDRLVAIGAKRKGDEFIEISVMDTGPGISSDKLQQVFDPFFTTKAEGMGMGLSISRTIIEAHGGRIAAESHPGGTSFNFTLPVVRVGADAN